MPVPGMKNWRFSKRPMLTSPWRWLLAVAWVGCVLLLNEVVRVTLGPNFHSIIPEQIYRSAQLSGSKIRGVQQKYGIRTIINLRNSCPYEKWYQEEKATCEELGISHFDLNFSTILPPAPQELKKLKAILETAPRPILLHCRRGADRTGLASAITMLLEGADFETAQKQLGLRHGHLGLGRVGDLEQVLDDYSNWLASRKEKHSSTLTKRWIEDVYRPGRCWAKLEVLDLPERIRSGEALQATVKLTNLSHLPWHFSRSANLGVHLRGYIEPEGAVPPMNGDKFAEPLERIATVSGFTEVTVQPGASYTLTIPLPVMRKPGPHTVYIDLKDEEMNSWFGQLGSQHFKKRVEVVDDVLSRQ